MTDRNDTTDQYAATRRAFEQELNQHGYGFQHAVIERARKMYGNEGSLWEVVASEVPVNLGTGTRIDVVMRLKKLLVSTLLIGECKKVNPAFGAWCFVPSPFTHTNRMRSHERLSIECLSYKSQKNFDSTVRIEHRDGLYLDPAYSIGLAIKEGQPGDSQPRRSSGSDAIEDAATQVMRGINGLVNALVPHAEMLATDCLNALLPVIFTTAKLFDLIVV